MLDLKVYITLQLALDSARFEFGSQKLLAQALKVTCQQIFLFPSLNWS